MSGDECFSAKTLPASGALPSSQGVGLLSLVKTGVTTTGPDPVNVKSTITDLFTEPRSTTALPEPSRAGAAGAVETRTKMPRTTVTAIRGSKRMRIISIKQWVQTGVNDFLQLGLIDIKAGIFGGIRQYFRSGFVNVLGWLCIRSRPISIQLPSKFALT